MSAENCPSLEINSVFMDRYKLIKRLGGGNFGKVYEVMDSHNSKVYALKIEVAGTCNSVLKVEAVIMKSFLSGHKHFARFITAGKCENLNYVIMTLLGENLDYLLSARAQKRFTLETTLRIGQQSLQALEDMHGVGYLHRDVKPSNFAIGRQPYQRCIYLFDFGLSRKFVMQNKTLRPPRMRAPFRGTTRYASLNVHDYLEQGPHDDLSALVYTLVEMLNGTLPWAEDSEEEIVKMKKSCTADHHLFQGFPVEMTEMFGQLRRYTYESIVDYNYFQEKFAKMIHDLKIDVNAPFEWEIDVKEKVHKKRRHTAQNARKHSRGEEA